MKASGNGCASARPRVQRRSWLPKKISQTAFHFVIAVAVMYWATGSLALGGLAAVLEPILNVIVLPYHDRAWERLEERQARHVSLAAS